MTFPKVNFKLFFIPLFVTSIFFISCQDTKEENKDATEAVPEATLEQKKQQLERVSPSGQSSSSTSAEPGALNPAHGQPGHRCDIAVGAPLDGSPAQSSPIQVNPVQNQTSTPAAKPADGLNPPHGQPGHRCDIKVGDPL